jgi:hypothetical protein
LNGFIAAGTGPQNDYAVAREYLSESIRSSWNPNQEVLIQRSSPRVVISDQDTAELAVDVAATVDADGKYQVTPLGTERVLEFSFVFENSQWRLSRVPDVTVLIRPVFDVVFSGYSVFFLDRQKRFLVPELRWFPTTPATGTRLVNAVLGGASSWLKPAVVSAIPSGTRLSIDAVTVENGVALVDLTARALIASREDRSLMKSQLEATLSQLSNVSSVAISIERAMQEISEADANAGEPQFRALAIVGEEGLELLASSQESVFAPGKNFFEQSDLKEVTLSGPSGWIATLTDSGIFRTRGERPGAQVEQIESQSAISSIEFDSQEYLWSANKAPSSELIVTSPSLEQSKVLAPWLAGQVVRALAISPGGSKIAMLVQGPSRTRVLVSPVVRNSSGTPIELAEPLEVAGEISNPSSVSWIDQLTIATVSGASGSTSALLSTIGGTARQLPVVPGTRKIVAAGTSSQLYLLTETGELFSYRGSAWTPLRQSIRALALVN